MFEYSEPLIRYFEKKEATLSSTQSEDTLSSTRQESKDLLSSPPIPTGAQQELIDYQTDDPGTFVRPKQKKKSRNHDNRKSGPSSGTIPQTSKSQANQVRAYAKAQMDVAMMKDAEDWTRMTAIPSGEELMVDEKDFKSLYTTLPENCLIEPWQSKEAYLRTHYLFFREEATRPLRETIVYIRKHPDLLEAEYNLNQRIRNYDIGVYDKVYFTTLTCSRRGIGTRVDFSLGRVGKNVKWDQSKRLRTGSLVALSPKQDLFQSRCITAVVAARPLDQLREVPPKIDLFFANAKDIDIDSTKEWIMVEAKASYFEAHRHTMLALQKLSAEAFPLHEHLVDLQADVSAPAYLRADLKDHPAIAVPENTTMDSSQEAAFLSMLAKRIALIQGPPGTGKTYVSVQAIRAMLQAGVGDWAPIIIACQTNHALDQLLRHVAGLIPDRFVRLGGRSKDTTGIISSRTLFELKRGGRPLSSTVRMPAMAMEKLGKEFTKLIEPLKSKVPLDYKILQHYGLLTEKQVKSLEAGDTQWEMDQKEGDTTLAQWVGEKNLLPHKRHVEAEDFGYVFDVEDLPPEELNEIEAEGRAADESDDIERLRGLTIDLSTSFISKVQPGGGVENARMEALLKKSDDMWDIRTRDRGSIYNYLQERLKACIAAKVRPLMEKYYKEVREHATCRFEDDWHVLAKQQVIGMTTTGLSKNRALIASLNPRVVLIEEAAETLEGPVTVACMESVEHLILVGDHKQLRPHCVLRSNEMKHYDVSIFERLVNSGIPHTTLTRQRRMVPEIRRILYPVYKDQIHDHPDMLDSAIRAPVPGMGNVNCYFFTHDWPEERNEHMSFQNSTEADMIVGFMDYLVKNGMSRDQITVLTFYNGQRTLILKKLSKHPDLLAGSKRNFHVVTVDSYQGEENDIVLLSTVRSRADGGSIGFVKVDNRVCVALSRAKRGFYIFGNAETLMCDSKTWASVVQIMTGDVSQKLGRFDLETTGAIKRRIGFYLRIFCDKHQRWTFFDHPMDWGLLSGGCEEKCRETLPCGHRCTLSCHPFPGEQVNCEAKCRQRLSCGHACTSLCYQPCDCRRCPDSRDRLGRADDNRKGDDHDDDNEEEVDRLRGRLEGWLAFASGGVKDHDERLNSAVRDGNLEWAFD